MSDFQFLGADGKIHKPSDPDYWQAKTRELEHTRCWRSTSALVSSRTVVSRLDGEDLQWPGDTYEPRQTEPLGIGAERVLQVEDRVRRLEEAELRREETA